MKRWKTLKQFQHVVFTHNPPNYKTNKHKTCWLFGNGHSTYPPCRSRWFVETWGLWFCQSRSSTSPIRMLILWWSVWTYQKLVEYYAYNIHVVEVCCANWIFLAYNISCKWRVLLMPLKSTLSVFQSPITLGFSPGKKKTTENSEVNGPSSLSPRRHGKCCWRLHGTVWYDTLGRWVSGGSEYVSLSWKLDGTQYVNKMVESTTKTVGPSIPNNSFICANNFLDVEFWSIQLNHMTFCLAWTHGLYKGQTSVLAAEVLGSILLVV